MRDASPPSTLTSCLLAALLWACPAIVAAQGAASKEGTPSPAVESADPRFRTPRATVRTFLIAMNQADDDPQRIEDAAACLDLSEMPPDRRDGGRLAFALEFILRSTNVPTIVIPEIVDGRVCSVGESKDLKLTLHRMPDGRWLFDGETLQNLPKMRLFLWQRDLAAGQGKEAVDVPADFRSPYAMFHTFIDALKKGDPDAAAGCLDLTDVPDPARPIVGRELAYKLKAVLDRSIFVIFQDLPDTSAGSPLAAVVHREGRITMERKVEGVRKGHWLFNRATAQSLDRLYEAFESKPLVPELTAAGRPPEPPGFGLAPGLWVRSRTPAWLRTRLDLWGWFSPALYQVVGAALLVGLVVPAYSVVVAALDRLARALMRRRGAEADDREIAGWARAAGCAAVTWLLIQGVAALDLRMATAGALLAILIPAFWVLAAFSAYQLIDPALRLVASPNANLDGASPLAAMGLPVVALVLKILVGALGLAAVLKLFDFDVATVLAGLGIGGLAVALAAQDTLKNFFGSLMLIADRTFHVGDLVQIAGNEGVVESVGLRTTRIRGLDGSLLTIPNSDLTTAHIANFGAHSYRKFRTRITVTHGTPPERLVQFRDGILDLMRNHREVRPEKIEVVVNALATSGIEILVQAQLDARDGHAELKTRDELILDILRLAERLGVAFDSPSIVVEREGRPRPNAGTN
ncbi:mechanosensitive ion channel family protein [Paludisphaera mucosa]|uniref:Mechanosensitive ion channel family protein n=1 Tax=Paludisphaera mucosa TaxID=3030827 RepID=A0ABT6F4Q6_9BACT|nr:mechanosensitive ion channel family protein [Paludisphaera mucosa]MDG3002555.1 mechanosensitive ion channel family protein [Paludisphaera mucosa]